MRDLLAYEIGRKYENTFSLYRKKGDEKPLLSTTVSGDYRFPLRRLLVGCAVVAASACCLFLGAALDRREAKK